MAHAAQKLEDLTSFDPPGTPHFDDDESETKKNAAKWNAISAKNAAKAELSQKWSELYEFIQTHVDATVAEALSYVGWSLEHSPKAPHETAPKDWKHTREVASQNIQARLAKGEAPFREGTKQLKLFDMLRDGCYADDIVATGIQANQVGGRVTMLANMCGMDPIATRRFVKRVENGQTIRVARMFYKIVEFEEDEE